MAYLILLRHGQSRWNLANKFTGWVDVPLSEQGIYEALVAGEKLEGLNIDIAFTSKLVRAHETLLIALSKQQRTGIFLHEQDRRKEWARHPDAFEEDEIPIFSHEALNERFYGDLQGQNKQQMREKYGEEQVHLWRRSWDVAPPNGESLEMTYKRTMPYFLEKILPLIREGKNVIVSAHGNSLRAIIKYLENISDEEIPHLELPTGKPLVYEYDGERFIKDWDHAFTRPVHWDEPQAHKF